MERILEDLSTAALTRAIKPICLPGTEYQGSLGAPIVATTRRWPGC